MVRKSNIVFVLFLVVGLLFTHSTVRADVFSSASFRILDSVINTAGGRSTSTSFILLEASGELGIGTSTITNFTLNVGFLTFPTVTIPTVTPAAGDTKVDLSWTSSTGALGWVVSGYTVGQSTTSGGPYTYTSLGNITSSSRTGLSNGITYYFVVLPEDAFGNTIATSTEVSAIPVAGAPPPPSGGGGGIAPSQAIITGFAAPLSRVYLLKDGQRLSDQLTGLSGEFLFQVSNVSVGNHLFSLYFEDPNDDISPHLPFRIGLRGGVTITVGDLLLAPTFSISSNNRDQIIMTGFTVPEGTLRLSLVEVASDEITTASTLASGDGSYTISLPTESLVPGLFRAFIRSFFNTLSSGENILDFVLGTDAEIEVVKSKRDECVPSDFNGDGRVNIIDFSILLFWFNRFEPLPAIDLNDDRTINLFDFSIMTYCWTG